MILDGIEVIVFDFDETLFNLNADWAALKAGADRRDIEMAAIEGRRFAPEIIEVIDALDEHYQIAILSKNLSETIETLLALELEDIHVLGRDRVGKLKPDPDGLQDISRHFGTHRLLMVGDSWDDIEAAQRFGCKSASLDRSLLGATFYIDHINALLPSEYQLN